MSDKTPISIKPWEVARTAWWGISEESIRNKIIEVSLRDENNLIHLNDNDELYTDLQLESWITPSDTLPVWVETWRVLVADGRPVTWTLILAKTTSWDEIKILYGDDGEIMVDNGTGTWKNITTAYFKTQAEYNALPARKNTDGNLYIIVDTHLNLMPFEELIELTPTPNAILAELNTHPEEYAEYYYENGDIQMQEVPSSQLPRADAYLKLYNFMVGYDMYGWADTNLTEQELEDSPFAEFTEEILAWEWFFEPQW